MSRTETIALYQPLLYSIALKMVGTLEDAEDIVQDTFEKWLSRDHNQIENTKAYLIKSVSNNCLQFLNSLKQKVARSTQSHEDQDLEDKGQMKSVFQFDIEDQLNEAWAILHRRLEPLERSIYVMREFFNVEYEELQHIFDKKKDNCRKLFSRAKAKLEADTELVKFDISLPSLPDSFKIASNFGHISEIITDLKKEIPQKFFKKI